MTELPGPGPARRVNGVVLDETGRRIIELLQQDGRLSYAAIGKTVGLSEAAARQRVQRLLESGAVRVVGVTDPVVLGYRRQAMIGVRTDGDPATAADAVSELDGVRYVVVTAGSFDLMVEIVAEDDARLLDVVAAIRAVETVWSTETFLHLRPRERGRARGAR